MKVGERESIAQLIENLKLAQDEASEMKDRTRAVSHLIVVIDHHVSSLESIMAKSKEWWAKERMRRELAQMG